MRFSDIIGQDDIKDHFIRAVKNSHISHAYIMNGEEGMGKKALAQAFAAYVLCINRGADDSCGECASCKKLEHGNHPDITFVTHEKTVLSVDDIRTQLNDTIDIKPYESEKKLYIVDEAELMTEEAQNALLKTIENPPEYAIILLLTANADKFLPTILSRCVRLNLKPLPESTIEKYLMKKYEIADYMAKVYAAFSQGNIGKAEKAYMDPEFKERRENVVNLMTKARTIKYFDYLDRINEIIKDKETLTEFLSLCRLYLRDVLVYKTTGDEKALCFSDENFEIRKQAGSDSLETLNHKLMAIDSAEQRLSHNVRADLVFTELFLELRK